METVNTLNDELPRIVVVDGEPGAGKTTQAELIANRLGYTNLTTGMFFCAAAASLRLGEAVGAKEEEMLAVIRESRTQYELRQGATPLVSIDGLDVSDSLFSQTNKGLATKLGSFTGISKLLESQLQSLPNSGRWVFDRGLATFPEADVKIWLNASPYIRAVRRCGQLATRGEYAPFSRILEEHTKRELIDRRQRILPPGTVTIDSSFLDAEAVFARISARIQAHRNTK